ncbi:Cro/CI family transcriptional regulator [Duganella sp. LjRoot269]|uniref:Cro/CI family transcriptional regulator n=1 Tax=Duganella sp. LjRoot269 TaxID=3342305 RepID=UPI003ED0DC23
MECTEKIDADELIAYLGGPTKAGALLGISKSAVCQWRVNGVPKMQVKYLRLAHPEAFSGSGESATSSPS